MTSFDASTTSTGPFPAAVDRFFEYLQDGVAVNRRIAGKWARAWGSPVDLARVALQTPTDLATGHGRAIGTWLTDETVLAQRGLVDSATAVSERVVDGSVTDLDDRRSAAAARD
ncbi:hypothetical protein FDO65_05060 [Nakamurella flava]|uniref:Uncharacterized protein n=1 Tax=Nakamurella flava TaxID=2576308 RepID=A0A4U6QL07_9ACTN|nr:hypothetical protein [Nakamurella flava]TKV61021.1 hypothetical protein FDO65_05060 [Nakamurella flava]